MRFLVGGRAGAVCDGNHSVRLVVALLVLGGGAAAGCSSDAVTRPATNENLALMARFDSVFGTLDPATQARRRQQFSEVITLLAFGAPVQAVQIRLNGATQFYSGVGGYIVTDDVAGHPTDSAYTVLAWRGVAADTLASVVVFRGLSTLEVTRGVSELTSAGQATGSAQAMPPHDTCTSYLGHLPPDVSVPSGLTCRLESVTVSASGSTDPAGTFVVPPQALASVRIDGQTGS